MLGSNRVGLVFVAANERTEQITAGRVTSSAGGFVWAGQCKKAGVIEDRWWLALLGIAVRTVATRFGMDRNSARDGMPRTCCEPQHATGHLQHSATSVSPVPTWL